MATPKIAVVIPAYKVSAHIAQVIAGIGPEVSHIFVVDDACPENSGAVAEAIRDKRIRVIRHEKNLGVGGATSTGYHAALETSADIVVKLDGDGQMNPADIPALVAPITANLADYAKGNRFSSVENLEAMPLLRVIGNAGLSFMTKLSSGYWTVTDPTNGFTAIRRELLAELRLAKLHPRFFFESDMLFRLNLLGAAVADVPMKAVYGNEKSNLSITKSLFQFPWLHFVNQSKRIFYSYYLKEMSIASFELPLGVGLLGFGVFYGFCAWGSAAAAGVAATTGNVMISALPIIIGFQLVLAFLSYDIASTPKRPRHISS
jgi:glycosyltransferase involved in cell wall biosynthesis